MSKHPAKRAVKARLTDSEMLSWLIRLINHSGTNAISDLPWSFAVRDGEDSTLRFDRNAIRWSMRIENQSIELKRRVIHGIRKPTRK